MSCGPSTVLNVITISSEKVQCEITIFNKLMNINLINGKPRWYQRNKALQDLLL